MGIQGEANTEWKEDTNTLSYRRQTTHQSFWIGAEPVIHEIIRSINSNGLDWTSQWNRIQDVVRYLRNRRHVEAHLREGVEVRERGALALLHQEKRISIALDHFAFVFGRIHLNLQALLHQAG